METRIGTVLKELEKLAAAYKRQLKREENKGFEREADITSGKCLVLEEAIKIVKKHLKQND